MSDRFWMAGTLGVAGVLLLALVPQGTGQEPRSEKQERKAKQNKTSGLPADFDVEQLGVLHAAARLVVLDVVVTDRAGKAVTGLAMVDFALREDGIPQKLTEVVEHGPGEHAASAGQVRSLPVNVWTNQKRPAGRAITVLVMDSQTMTARQQMEVRKEMLAFAQGMEPVRRWRCSVSTDLHGCCRM